MRFKRVEIEELEQYLNYSMNQPIDNKVHITSVTVTIDSNGELQPTCDIRCLYKNPLSNNRLTLGRLFSGTKEECQLWCDVRGYIALEDQDWTKFIIECKGKRHSGGSSGSSKVIDLSEDVQSLGEGVYEAVMYNSDGSSW